MKALFKSLRLINAGFLLGIAFMAWLYNDEINNEKKKLIDEYPIPEMEKMEGYPPNPSSHESNGKVKTLQELYDHYNTKGK